MTDDGIDKYLIGDIDDEIVDDREQESAQPVIVPPPATQGAPQEPGTGVPAAAPQVSTPPEAVAQVPPATTVPPAERTAPSREQRLAAELERLMYESSDIEAAALVSLDGFIMASALPEGMQEDRVGAMSAAILALGERAAAELGRGQLTQVFIEGEEGYVLLVAAGKRAVLTVLAGREAKLGLVLYDMRASADIIGETLQ